MLESEFFFLFAVTLNHRKLTCISLTINLLQKTVLPGFIHIINAIQVQFIIFLFTYRGKNVMHGILQFSFATDFNAWYATERTRNFYMIIKQTSLLGTT